MICSKCGNEIGTNTICPVCGNQGVVNTTPSLNTQPVAPSTPVSQVQPVTPVTTQAPVAPVQPVVEQQPVQLTQNVQANNQNATQEQPTLPEPALAPVSKEFEQQVAGQNGFQSSSIPLDAPVVSNIQPIGPTKKDNKKPLIIAMLSLVIILLLVTIFTKSTSGKVVNLKSNGTRTILVYMIGSDLEAELGSASADIKEILDSKFNEKDINVLIYTGGSSTWTNPKISEDENAIYEVKNSKLNKVKTIKQKDMTDSSTLKEFLSYGYDNYKSDLYDLILWDHGGGPVFGYGSDQNDESETPMTINQLTTAINGSTLGKATNLEFIGFDACLMSSVEIAYDLSDNAKYLVASEEVIPAYGWDYSFLAEIDKSTKTEELTKKIVDHYFDYYNELSEYYQNYNYNYSPTITLAVTKLDEVKELVDDIDNLFDNVTDNISVSNYSKVSKELSKATLYGYQGKNDDSYDLVDLYNLVEHLKDDYPEADKVLKAIKNTIVYEKNNIEGSNGLSIYFPVKNKTYAKEIVNAYQNISFSNNYKSFLSKYVSISNGSKLVNSNIKLLVPNIDTTENRISIDLENDLVENYDSAKYVVYRKLADNKYMLVNISSDVELNGNTLSAQADKQQLIVHPVDKNKPEEKDSGWVTMMEQERTDEYAIYSIIGILERYNKEIDKLEMKSVYVMYKILNGQTKGEIIDVMDTSKYGTPSAKGGIKLSEWQDIKFMNYAFKLFDENGEYLDSAETYDDYYLTVSDITENGLDFEFVPLDYEMSTEIVDMSGNEVNETTDEYYYQFIVSDTQGQSHRTQLIKAS